MLSFFTEVMYCVLFQAWHVGIDGGVVDDCNSIRSNIHQLCYIQRASHSIKRLLINYHVVVLTALLEFVS